MSLFPKHVALRWLGPVSLYLLCKHVPDCACCFWGMHCAGLCNSAPLTPHTHSRRNATVTWHRISFFNNTTVLQVLNKLRVTASLVWFVLEDV